MGIRTAGQYKEALRRLNPNIYVAGKKQENVVDNDCFQISLKEACKQFDWANDPETREEFTEWSDLINDNVTFWTALRKTPEDLFKMADVTKKFNGKEFCTFCQGAGPGTLYALTWEIDQARGTKYHQRYLDALKDCQVNDKRGCIGIMDAKGDRSKGPSQQSDPDLYVRVVDKTADGIYVHGAKTHTSNAPLAEFVIVTPCGVLAEEDKDYALAFMVPVDAPGLTFITRPAPGFLDHRLGPKEMEAPVSSSIGFTESVTIFDNVFVPWEHVFMCGEWEFTDSYIRYFSASARLSKLICSSSRTDIVAGAAALMAEYNGVSRASHIKNKLIDMMIASEIGWGCALGAISKSAMHPSGLPVPDLSIANAGLYHCRLRLVEFLAVLQEIAGGLVTTMPLEADYRNETLRPLIDKYLQGKDGIKTEDRLKLLYFINDLTASRFCGYMISSALVAGGTPETNRLDVARSYDLGGRIDNIKKWCRID